MASCCTLTHRFPAGTKKKKLGRSCVTYCMKMQWKWASKGLLFVSTLHHETPYASWHIPMERNLYKKTCLNYSNGSMYWQAAHVVFNESPFLVICISVPKQLLMYWPNDFPESLQGPLNLTALPWFGWTPGKTNGWKLNIYPGTEKEKHLQTRAPNLDVLSSRSPCWSQCCLGTYAVLPTGVATSRSHFSAYCWASDSTGHCHTRGVVSFFGLYLMPSWVVRGLDVEVGGEFYVEKLFIA